MRWLHLSEGTNWPFDTEEDFDCGNVQWRLRYNPDPARRDILTAAEILSAYHALIFMPQKRRNKICGEIQTQLKDKGEGEK